MSLELVVHPARRLALFLSSLTLAAAPCGWPTPLRAADTVETWEHGAGDVDLYVGYERGRGPAGPRRIGSDAMLGYGLRDRLSAYVGATVEGEGAFGSPLVAGLYAGLFGTPLDTRHLDLDWFLGARLTGAGLRQYELTPAFELNLDRSPERDSFGAYLRLALPVSGTTRGGDVTFPRGVEYAVEVNPGAYITVADGHQLFVEGDVTLRPGARTAGPLERGLAVGYNLVLSPTIELINEVRLSQVGGGGPRAFAFTAGFILTLPGR